MKKVLVTGGSGFLGSHIVEIAKGKGYEVCAPRSCEFNLITGEGLEEYMEHHSASKKFDVVIHSAAYYGGIGINQAEPATIFYKNTQMAINVFELARKYGIKKVIPIGSACSYPGHLTGDLKEEEFWNGSLHDSVEAYGFSKKIQLVAQKAYNKQYGIESNHLILTNLYGPRDVFTEYRSHVTSALIKKFADARGQEKVVLWGDGSPIREFMYVKDAAKAIVRAIELPHDIEPVNIGTGVGTTIKELAELIQGLVGFEGEIEWDTTKPNGTLRKVLDTNKMTEKFDWNPEWNLQDGFKETVTWYLENKEEADARE